MTHHEKIYLLSLLRIINKGDVGESFYNSIIQCPPEKIEKIFALPKRELIHFYQQLGVMAKYWITRFHRQPDMLTYRSRIDQRCRVIADSVKVHYMDCTEPEKGDAIEARSEVSLGMGLYLLAVDDRDMLSLAELRCGEQAYTKPVKVYNHALFTFSVKRLMRILL